MQRLLMQGIRRTISYKEGINYYKTLNVEQHAEMDEIKKNYYRLAKKYHPDLNKGHEDKFKLIKEAYEVIGDEKNRKDYDDYLDKKIYKRQFDFQREDIFQDQEDYKDDSYRSKIYQTLKQKHQQQNEENQRNQFKQEIFSDFISLLNEIQHKAEQVNQTDQHYQSIYGKREKYHNYSDEVRLKIQNKILMGLFAFWLYYHLIAKDNVLYVMYHEDSGRMLVVDKVTFRVNQYKLHKDVTKTKKFRKLYQEYDEHSLETAQFYYI